MNYFLSILLVGLIAIIFSFMLSGCTAIGTGRATLILGKPNEEFINFKKYFPDLVSDTEDVRQFPLEETTIIHRLQCLFHIESCPPGKNEFDKYISKKLGSFDVEPAELSVMVRDRSKLPTFLPTEAEFNLKHKLKEELLKISLNKDIHTNTEKLEYLANELAGMNDPDVPMGTVSQETKTTEYHSTYAQLFFYFPRIQIDFASRFRSPSQHDRFDYLGMVVRLKYDQQGIKESTCGVPRIINFDPKAADILEFTRGQFTQKAELIAKAQANLGKKESGATLGQDMSLTMTETFVNDLKDSIESRASGILDEGQTFFADFRGIKNKRIGGTYSYDIMFEVPASLKGFKHGFMSDPCYKDIRADIYLIGVVRHVYQPGSTGVFTKVPEPDNDKTYQQVVTKLLPDVLIWKWNGEPWGRVDPNKKDSSSK